MATVIVNDESLKSIGNAIREKNGLTDTYTPSEMPAAIKAIKAGGGGLPVDNPKEFYKTVRPKEWPVMEMPSEMVEENKVQLLYPISTGNLGNIDATYGVKVVTNDSSYSPGKSFTLKEKKYMNQQLISERIVPESQFSSFLSSSYYRFYHQYSNDSDYGTFNYIILEFVALEQTANTLKLDEFQGKPLEITAKGTPGKSYFVPWDGLAKSNPQLFAYSCQGVGMAPRFCSKVLVCPELKLDFDKTLELNGWPYQCQNLVSTDIVDISNFDRNSGDSPFIVCPMLSYVPFLTKNNCWIPNGFLINREVAVEWFKKMPSVTQTRTLYIPSTAQSPLKFELKPEDIAIMTNKGWTVGYGS